MLMHKKNMFDPYNKHFFVNIWYKHSLVTLTATNSLAANHE